MLLLDLQRLLLLQGHGLSRGQVRLALHRGLDWRATLHVLLHQHLLPTYVTYYVSIHTQLHGP